MTYYLTSQKPKLMRRIFILFVACIFFASCGSKQSIIPGFNLGMSESDWKKEITSKINNGVVLDMESDSVTLKYNWKISDTSIVVKASFNGDGIPHDDLRVIFINLNNLDGFTDTVKKGFFADTSLNDNVPFADLPGEFAFDACLKSRFDVVLNHIRRVYGKPDSVSYDLDDRFAPVDTVQTLHHFTNGSENITVWHTSTKVKSRLIPEIHYEKAGVTIMNSNYETGLRKVMKKRASTLQPYDIIRCTLFTRTVEKTEGHGLKKVYLRVWGELTSNSRVDKSETRDIEDLKGRIRLEDKFGDLIMNFLDVEIKLQGPIKSVIPGMDYLLGENVVRMEQPTQIDYYLDINHKECSEKLRNAVLNGSEINGMFIPELIRFSDGEILRGPVRLSSLNKY